MAKVMVLCLLLVGCAPKVIYKTQIVKVPVNVPCPVQRPILEPLPVEELNELTVRDYLSRDEYGEIVYRLGSSLILLDGDVKAHQEALEVCY